MSFQVFLDCRNIGFDRRGYGDPAFQEGQVLEPGPGQQNDRPLVVSDVVSVLFETRVGGRGRGLYKNTRLPAEQKLRTGYLPVADADTAADEAWTGSGRLARVRAQARGTRAPGRVS